MSETLNANPTIRNASDLPSRRRQASPQSSSKTSLGLFSSTVPASAYAPDPFTRSTSSESENSDDDDTVEPIDEQEIYGGSPLSYTLYGCDLLERVRPGILRLDAIAVQLGDRQRQSHGPIFDHAQAAVRIWSPPFPARPGLLFPDEHPCM